MVKKNDFDQGEYVSKVDDAHGKLKLLESRVEKVEKITDAGLILTIFKKDAELRSELENLIWKTMKSKAVHGFLWLVAGSIILPVTTKLFIIAMERIGINL